MEEIDIIELLKRVKEGKAPKEIQIDQTILYRTEYDDISSLYKSVKCNFSWDTFFRRVNLDTKIKILDKPIIEELSEDIDFIATVKDDQMKAEQIGENRKKINEIIRYLKKEEK